MTIFLTLAALEENMAVLQSDDGLRVYWPKEKLPEEAAVGTRLTFQIDLGEHKNQQSKIAKDILNELLDTDNA